MTTTRWKLAPEAIAKVNSARDALNAEVERLRDGWQDKSEHWQESDAGTEVDAWLEGLQNLADELDNLETEPE